MNNTADNNTELFKLEQALKRLSYKERAMLRIYINDNKDDPLKAIKEWESFLKLPEETQDTMSFVLRYAEDKNLLAYELNEEKKERTRNGFTRDVLVATGVSTAVQMFFNSTSPSIGSEPFAYTFMPLAIIILLKWYFKLGKEEN